VRPFMWHGAGLLQGPRRTNDRVPARCGPGDKLLDRDLIGPSEPRSKIPGSSRTDLMSAPPVQRICIRGLRDRDGSPSSVSWDHREASEKVRGRRGCTTRHEVGMVFCSRLGFTTTRVRRGAEDFGGASPQRKIYTYDEIDRPRVVLVRMRADERGEICGAGVACVCTERRTFSRSALGGERPLGSTRFGEQRIHPRMQMCASTSNRSRSSPSRFWPGLSAKLARRESGNARRLAVDQLLEDSGKSPRNRLSIDARV